jgi:hypothetical protein
LNGGVFIGNLPSAAYNKSDGSAAA